MQCTPSLSKAVQFNVSERNAWRSRHWPGSWPMRVRMKAKARLSASISTSSSSSSNSSPSFESKSTKASSGWAIWRIRPENLARWMHKERSARSPRHTRTSSDRKSNVKCRKAVRAEAFASSGCVPGMATWGGCSEERTRATPKPRTSWARPMSSSSSRGDASSSWATASASAWPTRTGRCPGGSHVSFRPTKPPATKDTRHRAKSKLSVRTTPSSDTRCNRGDSTHSRSSATRRAASASPARRLNLLRPQRASPAGSATASCGFSKDKSRANASILLQVGVNNRSRPSSQRSALEERKRSDGQQRGLDEASRIAWQTLPQMRKTHNASR
mmetsp:Transcript_80562/g.249989  ORF Transcript_80562/g.249989 Transcript_80562/m.249989 type:complete len:330 (-) Transcript_80562:337-1326(-)